MTFFTQLYPNFLFPVAGIPPWDVLTDAFQQQVLVETNWVRDVPTIEPEPLLRLIKPVRPEHLSKAGIRRSKLLISFCLLVLKIVGTVEVGAERIASAARSKRPFRVLIYPDKSRAAFVVAPWSRPSPRGHADVRLRHGN